MKKITRSEQLGQFIQNTKILYKNKLPQLKNICIYIYIYIYIHVKERSVVGVKRSTRPHLSPVPITTRPLPYFIQWTANRHGSFT